AENPPRSKKLAQIIIAVDANAQIPNIMNIAIDGPDYSATRCLRSNKQLSIPKPVRPYEARRTPPAWCSESRQAVHTSFQVFVTGNSDPDSRHSGYCAQVDCSPLLALLFSVSQKN